ncbi:MAG: nucleotide sugar dehydrogenase [Propioniciclava sp.]
MGTVTIVGQGYVGLPLAQAASAAGIHVWGLDTSSSVVDALNAGRSHVDDLSDSDIAAMLTAQFRATTDASCVAESSTIVICVPTPLKNGGAPDLQFVESACQMVGPHLRQGSVVILESTTFPGTTEEVCQPILEAASGLTHGEGFLLAFSPERVDPGRTDYGMANTPKLVGGVTPEATAAAASFYEQFIDTVVVLGGTREAETAKLLENTFRHVNIALVNEMARFCHELGIDIWEVIRGAETKPFGFMKFTPGPGVGGHCIPIDPNYLSYEIRKELGVPFRFVELAQEVNAAMPAYVVSRIADLLNEQRKPLHGSDILILGVTYKPNIADQRESPAVPVAELLLQKHAAVSFYDPYVAQWHVADQTLPRVPQLDDALAQADLTVVLQPHDSLGLEDLAQRAACVFDTRGVIAGAHRL